MKKRKLGRKLLGVLLTLAMVVGLMPGMSLTALADGTTYNPASAYTDYAALNSSNTVVTIEEVANVEWYVVGYDSEAKTVTLLSKTSFGNKAFNSDNSKGHSYANSEIKTFVEDLTDDGQPLAEIKDALANISVTGNPIISGSVPYLLSTIEANALDGTKKGTDIWWLRSPGGEDKDAACVDNGDVDAYGNDVNRERAVRPALQLNLESVIFDSESKKFSLRPAGYNVTITAGSNMTKTETSGEASQTGLSGPMTAVVYTADNGYYFPTDYSVADVSGIKVTRDSYTQITVSGTPTADASITLTAPTAKTKPDAPTTAAAVDCTTTDNNDGKLTGVTAEMEYKKSDASDWTAGTGSDITGLVSGTYYVRYKATDTTNASGNQELSIAGYTAPTYEVTYKVVNGTWSDDSTTDKKETVQSGSKPASVPTGMKAASGYTGGSWDNDPTDATITGATTFTYTFTAKQAATVTKAPEAKTLTYNGSAQELVTAGTATGGEMQYALGTATEATQPYTASIPTATDAGTYYVWYKANGDDNHNDSAVGCVTARILAPISATVTFKVVNGSWNEGVGEAATADKTVTLTGYEGDTLKLAAENIPAAGSKPGTNYKAGSWDITPSADTEITEDTTYTYTYQQIGNITATITFKVVNGSWDDGKTTNKTEILTGKEGDTLKLTAAQIPGVGTKPNDGYKDGSWDVTPVAGSEISGNKTYTYTYAAKNAAEVTKAPTAQTLTANGSAQELVTAGEAKGGTMYYAVTDNDQAPEAAKYATTIPTATEAGTYYVWYYIEGKDGVNDTPATCITVTIAEESLKVKAEKAKKNNIATISDNIMIVPDAKGKVWTLDASLIDASSNEIAVKVTFTAGAKIKLNGYDKKKTKSFKDMNKASRKTATISTKGILKAKKEGTGIIKYATADGKIVTIEYTVVKPAIAVADGKDASVNSVATGSVKKLKATYTAAGNFDVKLTGVPLNSLYTFKGKKVLNENNIVIGEDGCLHITGELEARKTAKVIINAQGKKYTVLIIGKFR